MPDFDPGTRKVLYLLAWIVGSISGTLTAVWGAVAAASPDVSMPLWLVITSAALTFVAAQLNLVARANVPSLQDVVDGDV
jgi:hypothetical protein